MLSVAGSMAQQGEQGSVTFAEVPVPRKECYNEAKHSATLYVGNVRIDIYSSCGREQLKTLALGPVLWYHLLMEHEKNIAVSTPEMVTILRAEYDSQQAQLTELQIQMTSGSRRMCTTPTPVNSARRKQTKAISGKHPDRRRSARAALPHLRR